MSDIPIGFRPRRPAAAPPPAAPTTPAGPTSRRLTLAVSGMTCGHCVQTVTAALQAVPGVHSVQVSQSAGSATVLWDAAATPAPDRLLAAVQAAGYGGTIQPSDSPALAKSAPASTNPWQRPLVLGVTVLVVLWTCDLVPGVSSRPGYPWLAFGLALPVQLWLGGGFFRGAWRQLRAGRANMDTLVSLGSAAAFGYSTVELFRTGGGHLFFTEAVTILTFISLGHWLEARLTARAGDAIRRLLQLTPERARRVRPATTPDAPESLEDVAVADLGVGDVIALAPGDRVPVDAVVLTGTSAVTESMLTGESLPVEKRPGAPLFAGTVNQDGRLTARVTALGEATALAGIVAAVERAQNSRAQIQRLADRASSIFVPIVVAIALLSALAWVLAPGSARAVHDAVGHALWRTHLPDSPVATAFHVFCAVLIVACPCALGLATPMALLAGVHAAARRGVLIRDALALEAAGRIDAVAFDKTGTLTEGRPAVVGFRCLEGDGPSASRWRVLASAIARPSRHPFSRAVVLSDPDPGPVTDWREERAAGVSGTVHLPDGPVHVRLGSVDWLTHPGPATPGEWDHLATGLPAGASRLGLAVDGRLVGIFALADPLRPDALGLLRSLAGQLQRRPGDGHPPLLLVLSGDHPEAVDAVLSGLREGLSGIGITLEARGRMGPADKAAALAALQSAGRHVAFVGDGLNDGPALAQADLGLAVSGAADVAREAADIVLLRPDLGAVVEALGIARATRRTIRQNLVWAFAYNAAAVPLAAVGLLHPVLCALAMGLSDLIVVGNALRLKHWRAKGP